MKHLVSDDSTGQASGRRGILPLGEGHNGRALVGENSFVRVYAGVQLVAQLPGLDDCARMA